jgi:hypothetical protein
MKDIKKLKNKAAIYLSKDKNEFKKKCPELNKFIKSLTLLDFLFIPSLFYFISQLNNQDYFIYSSVASILIYIAGYFSHEFNDDENFISFIPTYLTPFTFIRKKIISNIMKYKYKYTFKNFEQLHKDCYKFTIPVNDNQTETDFKEALYVLNEMDEYTNNPKNKELIYNSILKTNEEINIWNQRIIALKNKREDVNNILLKNNIINETSITINKKNNIKIIDI